MPLSWSNWLDGQEDCPWCHFSPNIYQKGVSKKGLPKRFTVVNHLLQQYFLDYPCHGNMSGYSEALFSGILSLHGNTWAVLKPHGKEQRHLSFAFLFGRNGHLKNLGSFGFCWAICGSDGLQVGCIHLICSFLQLILGWILIKPTN